MSLLTQSLMTDCKQLSGRRYLARAMAMTFNDPTGDLTVTEAIPGKGGAPGTSATS
jgi:hypothetical protein